MKARKNDLIMHNKIFAWLALITAAILMIPLIAMQFSNEWDWGLFDFLVIGTLIFGMGSTFVIVARNVRTKTYRIAIAIIFLIATLYLWAELAVGIFTNLGN